MDLVVVTVRRENDRFVFARIVAWIDGALDAVKCIERFARHRGRIAAALDVDEQRRLVRLRPVGRVVRVVGHVLGYRDIVLDKRHIDMNTLV